ncbi:hypothetical protein P261_01388 [Lachnospiraceae bacterium TWA4]|nr:hypothetical protein P261_01388 [Lachnospiraceae bacterium TWA4]
MNWLAKCLKSRKSIQRFLSLMLVVAVLCSCVMPKIVMAYAHLETQMESEESISSEGQLSVEETSEEIKETQVLTETENETQTTTEPIIETKNEIKSKKEISTETSLDKITEETRVELETADKTQVEIETEIETIVNLEKVILKNKEYGIVLEIESEAMPEKSVGDDLELKVRDLTEDEKKDYIKEVGVSEDCILWLYDISLVNKKRVRKFNQLER